MATAWYYCGLVYARLQEYDQALQSLTQAIQIEPEYIESYVDRSTTYGLRKAPGDLELSLADALKAVEISPDSAEAHVALAWSYLWLDKRTEALLNAYRAVELNSQLSAAYNVRASIFIREW